MNFWDSQYRRIWLPYAVRQCGKQENPKVCAILNRNYQPLSNVESISLATGTESGQKTKNLFGSVVKFKTDPAKFKDVWVKSPETIDEARKGIRTRESQGYLYDDGFHSQADMEDYFKRLRKLFSYSNELLSPEEIDLQVYGKGRIYSYSLNKTPIWGEGFPNPDPYYRKWRENNNEKI